MFAIQKKTRDSRNECRPNILPCRVHHNGTVDASKRYWNPQPVEGSDNLQAAYFRGRKLIGTPLKIPETHKGVLLEKTESFVEQHKDAGEAEAEDDERQDDVERSQIMEQIGSFDEIDVWEHETRPNQDEDPYFKGLHQWINLSQALHSYETPDGDSNERVR